MPTRALACIYLLLALTVPAAAQTLESRVVWRRPLDHAGKASPRAADVNADGVEDVIVGAGVEDRWGSVTALDGKTGEILWQRRLPDEVLSTPTLLDVNADGVPDIFVGGRTRLRDVYALSGRDGAVLWRVSQANPDVSLPPTNIMNLTLIDDRDGDGQRDLLVVQAGGKDSLRLAARLHVVQSARGTILSTVAMPDGRESYSIPVFVEDSGGKAVVLGTGGETLSGNLMRLRLPSFDEAWRVRGIGGGFIGSPLVVALDPDAAADVVAVGMDGAAHRVSTRDGSVVWRHRERPYWAYTSPAAGRFGADETLDVVVGWNRGRWPRHDGVRLSWLDGATGKPLSTIDYDPEYKFIAASPLVLDLDGDERDETLMVISDAFTDVRATDQSHRLVVFDGGDARAERLSLEFPGYAIATPRLADLDRNGNVDIVHATRYEVLRIELITEQAPRLRWTEMHGPNGAGVVPPGYEPSR